MKKYKKTEITEETIYICPECGEEDPICNNGDNHFLHKLYCNGVNDHLCPECYEKLKKRKR